MTYQATEFTPTTAEGADHLDDLHDLEDDLDQVGHAGGDEETGEPEAGSEGNGARGARSGISRAAIRRILTKGEQVRKADKATTEAAAAVLSTSTDTIDLTTAIMTADRATSRVFADYTKIAEADPFEAAVVAIDLGLPRLRAVHSLLAALGSTSAATLPASEAKAGMALARQVHDLRSDTAVAHKIEKVITLLKKS